MNIVISPSCHNNIGKPWFSHTFRCENHWFAVWKMIKKSRPSWGFLGASWDLDPVTRARLFNKRHGWQIKGLETAGGVTDAGKFTLVAPHSSCGASKYGNTTWYTRKKDTHIYYIYIWKATYSVYCHHLSHALSQYNNVSLHKATSCPDPADFGKMTTRQHKISFRDILKGLLGRKPQ